MGFFSFFLNRHTSHLHTFPRRSYRRRPHVAAHQLLSEIEDAKNGKDTRRRSMFPSGSSAKQTFSVILVKLKLRFQKRVVVKSPKSLQCIWWQKRFWCQSSATYWEKRPIGVVVFQHLYINKLKASVSWTSWPVEEREAAGVLFTCRPQTLWYLSYQPSVHDPSLHSAFLSSVTSPLFSFFIFLFLFCVLLFYFYNLLYKVFKILFVLYDVSTVMFFIKEEENLFLLLVCFIILF